MGDFIANTHVISSSLLTLSLVLAWGLVVWRVAPILRSWGQKVPAQDGGTEKLKEPGSLLISLSSLLHKTWSNCSKNYYYKYIPISLIHSSLGVLLLRVKSSHNSCTFSLPRPTLHPDTQGYPQSGLISVISSSTSLLFPIPLPVLWSSSLNTRKKNLLCFLYSSNNFLSLILAQLKKIELTNIE